MCLQIEDKKLKGRLRYSEKVVADAQAAAAKVEEWLLPGEAGELEAEGMERTWRFSQQQIAEVGAWSAAHGISHPKCSCTLLASVGVGVQAQACPRCCRCVRFLLSCMLSSKQSHGHIYAGC
jgi:hypothetical protein